MLKYGTAPRGNIVRRYADDSELGPRSHTKPTTEKYGAPMLVIHRGDLQRVLFRAAKEVGIAIRFGEKVIQISDSFDACMVLASGEIVQADLIIGADGIHSRIRKHIAGGCELDDSILHTGDAAYRVALPRERLAGEQAILQQMDDCLSARWLGPDGHIMTYPVRGNKLFNMVFVHATQPGRYDEKSFWSQRGDLKEMFRFHQHWSPTIHRLIGLVDSEELIEWPLCVRGNLPVWCINRVALMGDSCHPMVPYVAQGAAQAIEDAGALAACLSGDLDIPVALKVYESVRKSRAERIQSSAAQMRQVLHHRDGPEQVERDRLINTAHVEGSKHPDLWADPTFQDWVWGYDVVADTHRRLQQFSNEMSGRIYH